MRAKNRRDFIKKTALAATAGIILPNYTFGIVHAKSTNEVVGHGEFKYSVDKEWGVQDPSKIPVNDCHEMVLDTQGRIFMTTTGADNNNIIIYDKSGKVLSSWGTEFPAIQAMTNSNPPRPQLCPMVTFLWQMVMVKTSSFIITLKVNIWGILGEVVKKKISSAAAMVLH